MAAIQTSVVEEQRPASRRSVREQRLRSEAHALKVLAVIDGSERSGRVLDYLNGPALRHAALEVVLLNLQPEPEDGRLRGYGSFRREAIEDRLINELGRRAVASASRCLDQVGIAHTGRIELGNTAETVLRVAREERCDLILLGEASPGAVRRWWSRLTDAAFGFRSSRVVQLADVPVVLVK
jgi:nucleotide-binding universal stress UspA family protein